MRRTRKRCTAIVLAAGQGRRMGEKIQKQYLEIQGKPILYYSLQIMQGSPLIDQIILVTGAEQLSYCRKEIIDKYGFTKICRLVEGGAERYLSVWNGLETIQNELEADDREGYVFIHDGVRPFISEEMLERALMAVEEYRACVIAMPVKDTIKIADENGFVYHTPNRKMVWAIQTPQVFEFALAYQGYKALIESGRTDATDDSMIIETFTDVKVKLIKGAYENIKITTPDDLKIAEAFAQE